MLDLLADNPPLLYSGGLLLGLIIGSFLNVVIYRLPRMLEAQWHAECRELLADAGRAAANENPPADLNLLRPGSHCPGCGAAIKPWHNIPVLGFLVLRGRCASCGSPIGWRYPAVELVTGLLSVGVLWFYGATAEAGFALALTYALIALLAIDFDHKLLPDLITLPLLWLGLIANSQGLFTDLHSAVWGAVAGYGVLWLVFHLFRIATGKEGMGYGDFKLLAAIGAWFGWQILPVALLVAAGTGLLFAIPAMLFTGRDRRMAFAFGPYLALAAWVLLFWREELLRIISGTG